MESIIFLFILKSDHFFRIPKNNLRKQIAKVSIINYMQLSYNSTITEKQALHYLVQPSVNMKSDVRFSFSEDVYANLLGENLFLCFL